MGKWEQQQAAKRERKERRKTREDNLAKYLYDLSKLTFAGLVIGGLMNLIQSEEADWINVATIVFGIILFIILAMISNNILK